MKIKKCLRCQNDKPIQGNKKICDECRSNEWFGSKAERWLYSQVERAGIEVLPDTTDELEEVLELRKACHKACGYKSDGLNWSQAYTYKLGHRFPASKGGKLVADNLVIMPSWVNQKIGDNHGEGLEAFKVEGKNVLSYSDFRLWTMEKYEIPRLTSFKDTTPSDYEFSNSGLSSARVLSDELQRLNLIKPDRSNLLSEHENEALIFSGICNGEEAFWQHYGNGVVESLLDERKRQDKIMSQYDIPMLEFEPNCDMSISDYEYAIEVMDMAHERDTKSVESGNGRFFMSLDGGHPSHFDWRSGYVRLGVGSAMHRASFYQLVLAMMHKVNMTRRDINYGLIANLLRGELVEMRKEKERGEELYFENTEYIHN
ncbi:hypothetical protein [Vibrio apostichopi]|uniref:hypothetical protein n=1 Tax=Vibrio apostichopi TaxID=3035453 RepID=UPI0025734AB0|nr:hypothetical protein [Vibrio sp. FE10]